MPKNARSLSGPAAAQCRILIVDDDRAAADEYAESVNLLGYEVSVAYDAGAALRLIAADPEVGIVIADIDMPGMTGLSLLDEIAARFSGSRHIVALVITGYGGLDAAIAAMRNEAIDFLRKPVLPDELAAALRRAVRRWRQHQGKAQAAPAAEAPAESQADPAPGWPTTPSEAETFALLSVVKTMIRLRERRGEFLDPELFSDPVWDILLDLTSAGLEGKPTAVSSVCQAARVPMSTALRHIRQMVQSGLVRRWQDPDDRRRDLLELQPEALASMLSYIRTAASRVSDEMVRHLPRVTNGTKPNLRRAS